MGGGEGGGVGRGDFLVEIDEGVVDVVDVGATREDEVGGVRWGEEGDVRVGFLERGIGSGNVGLVNLVEWGPGEGRGGRRGH